MIDPHRLSQEVGNALLAARVSRGWTRSTLRATVLDLIGDDQDQGDENNGPWSLKALAAYELGSEDVTVTQLNALALALDVCPSELLTRAVARARGQALTPGAVLVDLSALSRSRDPRLQPLVAWAAVRVRHARHRLQLPVELGIDALKALVAGSGRTLHSVIRGLEDLRLAQLETAG